MKKLKLTIAGKVKTFDLPENAEYKCEVEETYVPKEGDCVMVESKVNNVLYWCKITDTTTTSAYFKILVNSSLKTSKNGFFLIDKYRIYTKITPEELKAKYAEAGYDWDYKSDTITPIKFVPKHGAYVWLLNSSLTPTGIVYYGDVMLHKKLLNKGLLFPTEDECQKFADHCWEFIHKKNK